MFFLMMIKSENGCARRELLFFVFDYQKKDLHGAHFQFLI